MQSYPGCAQARDLAPGASSRLSIALDKWALAFWDEQHDLAYGALPFAQYGDARTAGAWRVVRGAYEVLVGASAADVRLRARAEVPAEMRWKGL